MRALGKHRERLVEAFLLHLATAVVQIRRVEVREDACRSRAREDLAVPAHAIPRHSGARHPGVDLEMPGASGASPRLHHGGIAERGGEIGATHRVDLGAQDGREDDDRPRDAAATQLLAFRDVGDAEAPRSRGLERAGRRAGRRGRSRRPSPWAEAVRRRAPRGQPRCGATRPGRPRPRRVSSDGAVRYHVKTEQDTEPENSDARKART